MAKQIFAASSTGQTAAVPVVSGTVASVTISATGTAQLQIYLDGDWVGIRTADTTSTTLMSNLSGGFEWNIHGALGVIAIVLMLIHALWATFALMHHELRPGWR